MVPGTTVAIVSSKRKVEKASLYASSAILLFGTVLVAAITLVIATLVSEHNSCTEQRRYVFQEEYLPTDNQYRSRVQRPAADNDYSDLPVFPGPSFCFGSDVDAR